MMKIAMLGLLLAAFSGAAYSAGLPFGENRFSMKLEYELMDVCVGDGKPKNRAIKICVCALEKTMEDSWWPDYDSDRDYRESQKKFMRNFSKNRRACQK